MNFEGQSTNKSYIFNSVDYLYWKTRMKMFLKSMDYKFWSINEKGYTISYKK